MKETNKMKAMWMAAVVAGTGALSLWGVDRAHADEKEGKHDHAEHKDHDHDDHAQEKKVAGPNGGRIVHSVEPHLEFLVMEDRKIRISALDDDFKIVPIGDQSVTFIGGERTKPTRLSFVKEEGYLVSDGALPEGKSFPAVLIVKVSDDAKQVLERFQLDLNNCPTCKYLEYACICDHGHEHGEGHDHKHDHDEKHSKERPKPLKR